MRNGEFFFISSFFSSWIISNPLCGTVGFLKYRGFLCYRSALNFLNKQMRGFRYDKTTGRMYQLYFVNHYGMFLIMENWSKQTIGSMVRKLKKVQNNLILK